jgi:hypothetical protein
MAQNKASPFIEVIFDLDFIVEFTSICHHKFLTIIIQLGKHNKNLMCSNPCVTEKSPFNGSIGAKVRHAFNF